MKNFPTSFKGARIKLKALFPSFKDAVIMFEAVDQNRDHLLPYMGWAAKDMTKTIEDSFVFLENSAAKRKSKEKFEFGVYVEGKLCGTVGVFRIEEKHKSCEIGYWLTKDATGKGLVSESLQILENYLFAKYDINRIVIQCNAENKASANVAKRNGYKLDGVLRETRFCKKLNKIMDVMVFSKLYSEWKKENEA